MARAVLLGPPKPESNHPREPTMNRILMVLCAVLLGTSCDDRPKSTQRVEADNTAKNVRERADTVTPMDQGNSAAETTITGDVRKALMEDESLSFDAKNVKVVTVGKRVTLRGPVMSAEEKSKVGAMAARTAGVADVDNQLEVKTNPPKELK